MAKNTIRTYSTTAASNTDVGGVDIQGTAPASNMDDSVREIMSHLAETNAGTAPVDDTWSFCDPADATKKFRFDGGSITAGQTRVVTVPDASGTLMLSGSFPTAASLEGLTLGAGDLLYATAADTLTDLAIGTAGQFLVTNAGATAPEWASRPTLVSLEGLSLVQGDLLYATAADTLTRLAKGTAGQHLVMNAGATAPEWTAAADTDYEFVGTLTASGVSTLVCDTSTLGALAANYDYIFSFYMDPSNDAYLYMQYGTGGTPTYQTSGYVNTGQSFTGTAITSFTSGILVSHNNGQGGASSAEVIRGEVTVPNPGTSQYHPVSVLTFDYTSAGGLLGLFGGGQRETAEVVTGVKFLINTGTMTGYIDVYRRKRT